MLTNVKRLVTPAVIAAAAPALLVSGTGTAQAAPGPDVWFEPPSITNLGLQLIANIKSNTDDGTYCEYTADGWYHQNFYLNGRERYRLAIVPAVPKMGTWNIDVRCDNGAETHTTTFF